jgi:hypothetical protein
MESGRRVTRRPTRFSDEKEPVADSQKQKKPSKPTKSQSQSKKKTPAKKSGTGNRKNTAAAAAKRSSGTTF